MRIHKVYVAVGLLMAFALFFELAAHADEMNESTKVTFNAPIQISGRVLPAGTYVFLQADPDNGDPNLVQIFNADGTVLYATVQTVSAERMQPGDTEITLAEPGAGKPDLLLKWFYPGQVDGHAFVYSSQQEQELARDKQQTFIGNQAAGE